MSCVHPAPGHGVLCVLCVLCVLRVLCVLWVLCVRLYSRRFPFLPDAPFGYFLIKKPGILPSLKMHSAIMSNIASYLDDRDVIAMSKIKDFREPLEPALDAVWAPLRDDAARIWEHLTFGASMAPSIRNAVFNTDGVWDDEWLVMETLPDAVKNLDDLTITRCPKMQIITITHAYDINGRYELFITHEFSSYQDERHFARIGVRGHTVFALEDTEELPWSEEMGPISGDARFAGVFILLHLAWLRSINAPVHPDDYDYSFDRVPDRNVWAQFAATRFESDPFV
jgi:hypothetical protein